MHITSIQSSHRSKQAAGRVRLASRGISRLLLQEIKRHGCYFHAFQWDAMQFQDLKFAFIKTNSSWSLSLLQSSASFSARSSYVWQASIGNRRKRHDSLPPRSSVNCLGMRLRSMPSPVLTVPALADHFLWTLKKQ